MTPQAKLDRAIREAELARSDYFDGKVGDADYILRVLSLFTDVMGEVIAQQFAPDEKDGPFSSKTQLLRDMAAQQGIPVVNVTIPTHVEDMAGIPNMHRSNVLPFTPRSAR